MQWRFAAATAMALVACSAFDTEADPPPGALGDGGATPPSDAGADASSVTGFCATAGATVCTDFEGSWESVLDTPEPDGNGLSPTVRDSGDPARGKVYVTRFDPTIRSPDFALSRSAHHGRDARWVDGIPPRRYEVKVYIEEARARMPVAIFGWNYDDGTPHTIFVECSDRAEKCLLRAHRGDEILEVKGGAGIARQVWTTLIVTIGPTDYTGAGDDDPRSVTIRTQAAGEELLGDTLDFSKPAAAPRRCRVDVGLGLQAAANTAWEVWYDDLALTY